MKNSGLLSPTDYRSWVDYLDGLAVNTGDADYITVIENSSCPEYKGVHDYFNRQVEKTVNVIINNGIRDLKKDVSKSLENNEISGLHIIFARFSKKLNKCLFFCYIPFLDVAFKNSLTEATEKEITDFWKALLCSIRNDVEKTGNSLLEEELFLIERIHLFEGTDIDTRRNK